jgi:hypothetical protein
MDPFFLDIKEKQETLVLEVGDMLIDNVSLNYGVLVSRERKITVEDDDIYVWKIFWTSSNTYSDITLKIEESSNNQITFLEEVGLKISIIIDYFELIKKE